MLSPKRTKYRKKQRRVKRALLGAATRGNTIAFGEHGLVSAASGWVTNRQIEAARIAMTRHVKRGGKVWIRIFPDMPYTKKPAETRMGKGKGNPEHWVAPVRPGTVMFELAGVSPELAQSAMELAASKLPIRTKFISRKEIGQDA
jgi:large subunit ribosomal protein L16